MEPSHLRRSIGLPLLTLYGLGTILGAGIYVLIGEVVALAGPRAPSAFLLAAVLAGVTAFSFAELGSRVPKSAGEAAYAQAAFNRNWLAATVGWAVVAVGTVSAATMVRGFVGYLDVFVALPSAVVIIACISLLAAIASWGIGESLTAAAAITVLEILGLVFVCAIAADSFGQVGSAWRSMLPSLDSAALVGVVSGAFIAFYAFIGFEDIVNIAEEVKQPRRNLPRAIVIALVTSTTLYVLVAVVAVFAVPQDLLAGNEAPLAVIAESRGYAPGIIAAISLFAVVNGALIQIIMASRVLYGLASDGLAPAAFARIHARTQTPVRGTLAVAGMMLVLSLFLSLGGLARITSFIALGIFTVVNVSLWRLKRNSTADAEFEVPAAVPIAGALLCVTMIGYEGIRIIL
ncbi:MAG TPA: amino acid permease [Gammaproteobacteria bacterium]